MKLRTRFLLFIISRRTREKKLNLIGFNRYQPIKYSNIYFSISDFTTIENKLSNLNNLNEKEIKKK